MLRSWFLGFTAVGNSALQEQLLIPGPVLRKYEVCLCCQGQVLGLLARKNSRSNAEKQLSMKRLFGHLELERKKRVCVWDVGMLGSQADPERVAQSREPLLYEGTWVFTK